MKPTGEQRFRIERQLGSGSFGIVYQAIDVRRQHRVALKLLHNVGSESLYRFKREFRSLAGIRHRNLASLYELMSDGKHWFYTMELVEGSELLQYLAEQELVRSLEKPVRPVRIETMRHDDSDARVLASPLFPHLSSAYVRDLRLALRQLVDGVAYLHSLGKLHRDVKPSNILVTPAGRVVLLDFGLVFDMARQDFDDTNSLVGTPGYMAPEQGSAMPITTAADWYGVGVVLFQALTGRLPFTGSIVDILHRQKTQPPPEATELVTGVPTDLSDLARDLLNSDASKRPTGEEVIWRLGGKEFTFWLPPFRERLRRFMPAFGRESILSGMRQSFAEVKEGSQRSIFLRGESGMGKTFLLDCFFDALRQSEDVSIFAGRCYERETVPFKAIDSIIDSLMRFLRKKKPDELSALLPTDVKALSSIFPVFDKLDAPFTREPNDLDAGDDTVRRRASTALRELFARAAAVRPIVIAIDDAQWGDPESARVLSEILKGNPRILFVASFTTEDEQASAFIDAVAKSDSDIREISLDALPFEEARAMVTYLLGDVPALSGIAVDGLVEETGANPYFLSELCDYLNEHWAQRDEGPVTLIEAFSERINSLPAKALALLNVIAVAGKRIDLRIAQHAAELGEDTEEMLSLLREHRLVRSRLTGDVEELEIYHRRIGDVVLGRMTPAEFRQAHYSLAEALGIEGADRVEIGWHVGMSQLLAVPPIRPIPSSSGSRRHSGSTSPA